MVGEFNFFRTVCLFDEAAGAGAGEDKFCSNGALGREAHWTVFRLSDQKFVSAE